MMSAAPLIAVDARHVRPGMTGVGRRAAHLLREVVSRETDWRWGLFTNTPDFLAQWLGETSRVTLWRVAARPESHPANEWWLNVTLPRTLRREGAALFHGPAFQIPWRRLSIPTAVTIHDLAHRERPRTQPWRFRRMLDWSIARASRTATGIVVPSPAVEADLAALHPRARDRITVIPGGVSPAMRPLTESEIAAFRAAHDLPARCLLHIGTFEPRKNHRFLLEAHGALCAEMDDPPALVMVGASGPMLPRVRRWIARSPWCEMIHLHTDVTDADLAGFLSAASVFVFPSQSEGFGLPVIEAMACGAPVVASDVKGLDTFRDSPATLLPLGDVQPWTLALRRLLTDPAAHAAASERGSEHAATMTWSHAADSLIDLHRDLLQR